MLVDEIPFIPRTYSSLPESKKEEIRKLIWHIAKTALKELAVSLIFAVITIPFITTPFGIGMVFVSLGIMTVVNATLRTKYAHTIYKAQLQEEGTEEREEADHDVSNWKTITKYMCPITFSQFDLNTRETLLHEAGHALTASILFKDAKPQISLNMTNPFKMEGFTRYWDGSLSGGKDIGHDASTAICSASGTGLTFLVSLISIGVSHKIRKKHPNLSKYLIATAITSIANSVMYALSAFWMTLKNGGHDFLRLWASGVHPAVFIVSLVVIPIIVKGCMMLYDKHKERKANAMVGSSA